jgi:hypothetical protein
MANIYCFDLDGTLCHTTNGDYEESIPHYDRIRKVNKLHKAGHRIIVDTARGSETGLDWFAITKDQLDRWGVLYHVLRVGTKIAADFYIDDKAIVDNEFFKYVDGQMQLGFEIE